MYKIVKNKPIPKGRREGSKYPFAQMKVGDAFSMPMRKNLQNVMSSNARSYAKTHNPKAKFTTRIIDDVLWIWRTA